MTPQSPQQVIFLNECQGLSEAAYECWLWLYDNLSELEESERREMLDNLCDAYVDHYPDQCPQLESEREAEIAKGIAAAKQKLDQELSQGYEYEPAPWMTVAMQEADENIGK